MASLPAGRRSYLGTTMMQNKFKTSLPRKADEGFTLIEVMIAIVVMAVGLLAVIASFATAISATQSAEEDLIARQKVLEAMESIYTARNAQQIPFASVANVSAGGVFLDGAQLLKCAGPDGLVGTADDVTCTTQAGANCPGNGAECMVLPGPDGILGDGRRRHHEPGQLHAHDFCDSGAAGQWKRQQQHDGHQYHRQLHQSWNSLPVRLAPTG